MLQSRGVPVIGLTATSTGAYGQIQSMEDWRIRTLEKMGISFKECWKHLKKKQFPNFNLKDMKSGGPIFKSGILFSSEVPKGEVLHAFLQYAKFKPKKIIFIDDRHENIESVQKFCKKASIEFVGFKYSGAYTRTEPLNKPRALFLYKILENEYKWLSDKEADRRLSKNKGEPG